MNKPRTNKVPQATKNSTTEAKHFTHQAYNAHSH